MTVALEPRPVAVDLRPARRDRLARGLVAVAVTASLVVVTALWVDGGGPEPTGWADGLTATGRLAGLIASDLLLLQVLLMARIPALERAVGQDRLARIHRLTGFGSFTLLMVHIGLITWGYAAGSLLAWPGTFWDLTTDYAGMLLAVAGAACLVLVVVTSIRAARSRLRYESWHLLHLYAYLGVGLALPHQLWTGQDFLTSTTATVYWWTLWALAAAAVLIWRIGVPVTRTVRHRLRVTSVVPEGADAVSVYLTGRALHRLPVSAGQFLVWRFRTGIGWSRGHPYSLSAAPDGHSLRITVRTTGDDGRRLPHLQPGTTALIEGPYGRLTERPRTRSRLAFVGAGVGVAPLRALAEGMTYAPGDAVLIQRGTDRPLFAHELDVLAHERGLAVRWLPGHRRADGSWLGHGAGPEADTTHLLAWVPDIAERDVYVCGPTAWTAAVRHSLDEAGVPEARVHVETFGW